MPRVKDIWPIDPNSARPPEDWKGWPEEKKFALVLTHDVETAKGQSNCLELMNLEMQLGFRSSFNFVPEGYPVSAQLRKELISNGFEIGVQGLKHDGKLYQSEKIFLRRAIRINYYLEEWNAAGFRSPAMHHNLEWIERLNIEYDASTFDTDPFEPQSDAVGTIFPFWFNNANGRGYVELPYTLPQDFTLFILMQKEDIGMWQNKLDWIAKNGGMAHLIVHPDYMNFNANKPGLNEFPADYYVRFLRYIKENYLGQYWAALPHEVAAFYRNQIGKPVASKLSER